MFAACETVCAGNSGKPLSRRKSWGGPTHARANASALPPQAASAFGETRDEKSHFPRREERAVGDAGVQKAGPMDWADVRRRRVSLREGRSSVCWRDGLITGRKLVDRVLGGVATGRVGA
jgi:hypothetical protein